MTELTEQSELAQGDAASLDFLLKREEAANAAN